MFVLMGSRGEYSDRSVWTIGWTAYEDYAKELVLEYTKRDQVQHSIDKAKSDLRWKFIQLWDVDHPYPTFDQSNKPKFDQTQHRNKEYVVEHTERKRLFEESEKKHRAEVYGPWMLERSNAANEYVEANFTMDLCEPPEWTDSQYWYEEIKELI